MTYALVIVEGPILDADNGEALRWTAFVRATEDRTKPSATIERLGQGSWLIPLESDLQTFCALVEDSRKAHFVARVMFLEQKPSFVCQR